MNAAILCVGSLKEKYFTDACNEYLKRLTRYGSFELKQVPDLKIADKSGVGGADGLTRRAANNPCLPGKRRQGCIIQAGRSNLLLHQRIDRAGARRGTARG